MGDQPPQPPAAINARPSRSRRATASSSAHAWSAVASVRTSGVCTTATPRARQASRSTWSVPTEKVATTRSPGPAASSSGGVDAVVELHQQRRRPHGPRPELGRRHGGLARGHVDLEARVGERRQPGVGERAGHQDPRARRAPRRARTPRRRPGRAARHRGSVGATNTTVVRGGTVARPEPA